LRELRHPGARAAREATAWLLELEFARKSPRTVSEYGRIIDALMGRHPDRAFADFTDDELLAHIISFPEASRPVAKAALNSWFRWGRLRRKLDANPMEFIPPIKAQEQRLVPIFSEVDIARLCGLELPDGVLMRLLLTDGIRKGEAEGLQVKHVNFDARHIEVRRAKGNKQRLVTLSPTLAGKLDHWFTTDGMNPDDFLWYARPGGHWRDHSKQIASSSFYRWWKRCLEEAGVEYRRPHTTRHTMATRAVRGGVDVDKVRRTLGHKKISTTVEMYVHMSVDDMHDDFAQLETF
jgi:integrase